MKILFLVENTDNLTARKILKELAKTNHDVTTIAYFQDNQSQCSIESTNQGLALSFKEQLYYPKDFDGAFLWCWGTADIGRKYLRLFEDHGVAVLNSSYQSEITDSKIKIAELLQQHQVPTPKTLAFNSMFLPKDFAALEEHLGQPPYVFKADYGTRGKTVEFIFQMDDLHKAVMHQLGPKQSGFVLQEFVGSADQPITHYRVIVTGDQAFPTAMKVTAPSSLQVSNIFNGGTAEYIATNDTLAKRAQDATQASGLSVAGVDIMKVQRDGSDDYVVLEVNDGPGTKTFDKAGFALSQHIVKHVMAKLDEDRFGFGSDAAQDSSHTRV